MAQKSFGSSNKTRYYALRTRVIPSFDNGRVIGWEVITHRQTSCNYSREIYNFLPRKCRLRKIYCLILDFFFLPSACSLTKQQDDHYLRTIRRDEMNVKWPKWKALLRTWIPLEPVRPEHLIPAPWRHSLLPRVITGGDSRQVIVRQARTTLGRASLISFDTRMDVGEEMRDLLEAYVLQSEGRERDGEIWEESEGVRDTINTRGLQCI